ncbi:hypothetical protein E4T56_gene9310, partial [Termitomyces sp. T112]
MFAILPARQNMRDGRRRKGTWPAKAGGHLKIAQRVDPFPPRHDIAAAQRGRERLGKTADADHALQTVQHRHARHLRREIGKDIVLDNHHAMGGGDGRQAMRDLRRQTGPGGIVQRRIGQIEPGPFARDYGFKFRRIGAGGAKGHADHPDIMRGQQGLKIEIARIVEQDRIARTQHHAAEQPLARHAHRQLAAQAWLAPRRAIEREQARILRRRAQGPAQSLLRHPVGRQPAAARLLGRRIGIERLARNPEGVHFGRARGGVLRRSLGRRGEAGNEETRFGHRLDQAFGHHPVIGLHHRGRRDMQHGGALPYRGQFVALAQQARGDPAMDAFD